jgi:hypothetical protein
VNPQSIIRKVLDSMYVEGMMYPLPLAPEVAEWYCYTADGGHCIMVAISSCLATAAEPWLAMVAIPVRAFLRPTTHRVYNDGYWVVDLPYDDDDGVVSPEEDEEFESPGAAEGAIWCRNEGPLLSDTNFFRTSWARQGIMYLSFNSRAARLLLPAPLRGEVEEMRGAEYVVISKGVLRLPLVKTEDGILRQPPAKNEALELMFEDHSRSPYVIHLSRPQYDPAPAKSDRGRTDLELLVYTDGPELRLRLPARYRSVARLPHLRPWR